jgi:hypothetical protein
MKKAIIIGLVTVLSVLAAFLAYSGDIVIQNGGLNVSGVLTVGNALYADPTAEKVGINTESPQSALDVNGNITVSDCIVFASGGDWCSS